MVMVVVMMVMRGPGAVRRCGSRNKGDRSGQEQRGEYFFDHVCSPFKRALPEGGRPTKIG